MAEKTVTPQQIKANGVEPTYLAASGTTPTLSTGDFAGTGDQFVMDNDGKTWLHVKNAHSGTECNLTVQTPFTQDGLALADLVVEVDHGDEKHIGPFPRITYGDPLKFALDSVADVTLAALKL